uniref:VWFA domain-containing protein n=1 Tax=Cyprinus carpio TaxID=7962 RepID=A0A8C2KAZ2_CYPCA
DVTTYNGMCFKISSKNFFFSPTSECPTSQIDIAFLMDGSGSVRNEDFNKMKVFVIEMIKSFIDHDTQFAIAQFSTDCEIHHKFQQVKNAKAWEDAVTRIHQQRGWTKTATAIKKLVKELFVSEGGARPSASKILVVITDGESTEQFLNEAVQQAQKKNIIRYAIGVGNAFNNVKAAKELAIIASLPTNKHVFKVTDFDALESIREQLKENIIAIEGMFTDIIMTAVGAFQWKGGYQLYTQNDQLNVFQAGREHDSYLGYSLAIATAFGKKYAVMGAPRHKHKGQVTVSRIDNNPRNLKELDPPKPQIGSYFGAEVCVVDLNKNSRTVLLLVSAPTYIEPDREGKVFVYTFNHRSYFDFSGMELVGMAGQRGRFGSSLASPADLNGDGYMDVLIGAPLEEDGQGSIYIFNGGAYQINPTYSQRIAGSSVRLGLRFFGISLSQSSLDQSRDSLPDIAVGAMGAVLLLRCLTANINYTIILDAKRQKNRAYFLPKNRFVNDVMNISLNKPTCKSHPFLIDAFSEDALNPLSNQLTFTFDGLPSAKLQNIRPILLPGIKTTTDHNLDFEINCGSDDISNIYVGIMQEINVTVFVENRGENSYNTLFTLSYPFGLSYRRIISKQGRVECVSLDSEQKGSFGETTCHISKPILKGNSQVRSILKWSLMSLHGKNCLFQVENDFRELSFKVFIRVPVMLGDKSIWANKNIQVSMNNCSVAVCAEFSCDDTLSKNERKFYNITGNVSSGWIEPYIHIFLEVYEEVNLTKEIAGGVIGGLLLLALITVALYKAGFFKSHYKELLENAEQSPEDGPTTK